MILQTERIVSGIPLCEFRLDDPSPYKGVCYLVHGHTGSKKDLGRIPLIFANAGWFVVAIDAYKHGLRKAYPYTESSGILHTLAMPEVIRHTCEDIVLLQESIYFAISSCVGVSGVSMGGHIAYQMPKYLANIEWIVPIIGSPDLYHHYHIGKKTILGDRISEVEDLLNELMITDLSPYRNVKMFLIGATRDSVVDYHYGLRFFATLEASGHTDIRYYAEPVGHLVSPSMEDAIESFAKSL